MMASRRIVKKRSPNWADNEVNLLLEVWKDNKKKLEIHRGKRNIKDIYEEISAELAGYYCYRTGEEVSTKIENMSKRFRYERTKELETGTKSEWRFYWQVDDILGNNPTYCVEYIRDSIKIKAEEEKKKKEDSRATILMFKHPEGQKEEALEGEVSADSPQMNVMDMSDYLCDDEELNSLPFIVRTFINNHCRMRGCVKFLAFLFIVSGFADGKLDIKCINGRPQNVPITYLGFGNVYSPGYTEGKPYPNQMSCKVTLTAAEGKYIRLTYNYIDIAYNLICREDRLMVYEVNPKDNSAVVVGQYCGNVRVPDYVSTKNTLVIDFATSMIGSGAGFNITYREVSGRDICKNGEFQCRSRRCIALEGIRCNGKDDCGDGTDEEGCDYPAPSPTTCGVPEVQPFTGKAMVDRIVGGREAVRGSWPWQVDMQRAYMQPNGHFCGGSLINSQWFITAAHCVQPVRKPFVARIHLGNHHKYKEDPYEQVRYMKDFFVYGVNKEEFIKNGEFNMSHDLALGKLNAPVSMNPHVQVVCLPQQNEELKTGEKCFATGWGITRGSKSTDVLKQAEHPIQTAKRCDNIFQKFENQTMICAGRLEPLNGLCHGDSGGPLVCKKGEKWHVYGAASFVTDSNFVEGLCGILNKPTVFSKVSHKIRWIETTISNNS